MKYSKIILAMVVMLTTIACFAFDQDSEQFLCQAHQAYLQSLKSTNAGVRNSAIFNTVQFKKLYPERNIKSLVKEIRKISQNDPSLLNKLHAHLALICLAQPAVMATLDPNKFIDPVIYFNEIYDQLSEPAFALK